MSLNLFGSKTFTYRWRKVLTARGSVLEILRQITGIRITYSNETY